MTHEQLKFTMNIKLKKLTPTAITPVYQTPGSAACDLHADLDSTLTIAPGERVLVPTGIALEPPDEPVALLIFPRSGLASKHGIALSNGVGVIDRDYRGEIKVALINLSDTPYTVSPSDRIAQLMLVPIIQANFIESSTLDSTERGEGGFGHSG